MPRYEIAAHLALDLDCETPEEAAAIVRQRLDAETSGAASLCHLAVWPMPPGPTTWPVPAALRRQLAAFFADVDRYVAGAEEVFRARVDAILASDAGTGARAPAPIVLEHPRPHNCRTEPPLGSPGTNGAGHS